MSAALPANEHQPHSYVGRTFGGFRLLREIASGGMATVYLADKVQAPGIRQVAAVKVIHPHLAFDQDFVEMFLDEARIVSCINHPNVCRILDFGQSEGTYYLAMEYVMGETCAEVMTRMASGQSVPEMAYSVLTQIVAQACEGLHAAHEARDAQGSLLQIVHRDVSPQNIMVGYDGSVRVLDFGIASAAERLHTTRSGTVKGRLSYMAPEQMRGTRVDRRADIWSLGVVLWEGLARQRLFRRETDAQTILAVTDEPLPSLLDCSHPIPPPLPSIVSRALERDREARYPTARELGLALARFAAKSNVPVGMPEVSGWMHYIFAEEMDAKYALLRETMEGVSGKSPPSGISRTHRALLSDGSNDGTRSGRDSGATFGVEHALRTVEDRETRPVRKESRAPPRTSAIRPVVPRAPWRRKTSTWIGAALVAVLFVMALATVTVGGEGEPKAKASAESMADAEQNADMLEASESETTLSAPAAEASATPREAVLGEKMKEELDPVPNAQEEAGLVFDLAEIEDFAERSAERPSPRPARPVEMGIVNIATSGGWADVYLGTRKLGTTPARVSLPVGVRTLRFRRFGTGPDVFRRVVVSRAVPVSVKVTMP